MKRNFTHLAGHFTENQPIHLTMSFGDDAACMNQSCVRKSLIDFFSDELVCGHCVPGKRRTKPLVEPKYCHDSAASRSKLLANIGSKCADHATDDCTFESVFFLIVCVLNKYDNEMNNS